MNAWQYLGIPPNSDKRTIKTAYARLVKDCHPEEKPDEFMALRQAYEMAMSRAAAPRPRDEGSPTTSPVAPSPASFSPRPPAEPVAAEPGPAEPKPELEPQPISRPQPVSAERKPVDGREVRRLAEELAACVEQTAGSASAFKSAEALLNHPLLEFMNVRDAIGDHVLTVIWRMVSAAPPKSCPVDRQVLLTLDGVFGWSSGFRDVPRLPMDNLYLLLDAAHTSEIERSNRLGWKWLGRLMARSKGRISRLEWLFAFLVLVSGTVATLGIVQGVMNAFHGNRYHSSIFIIAMLLAIVSFFAFTTKRSVDAGVTPTAMLIISCIFPGALLFFILGSPKEHSRYEDPRNTFTDPLDAAYWDIRGHKKRYSIGRWFRAFFRKLSPRLLWGLGGYIVVGFTLSRLIAP